MWPRRFLIPSTESAFGLTVDDLFDPPPTASEPPSIDGVRPPIDGLPKAQHDLSKWLKLGTILPPDAQERRDDAFVNIGAGACGSVFTPIAHPLSIKVQKNFADNHDLREEALQHIAILKGLEKYPVGNISVPQIYAYKSLNEASAFFKGQPVLAQVVEKRVALPMPVLICDRILPLTRPVREQLIMQFCPEGLQQEARDNPSNQDCLVRVYLGQERQGRGVGSDVRSAQWFSLRNLKLYLDDMDSLFLDIEGMAFTMGQTLAVLHFVAHTDARDVEFVLGSSKVRRQLRLDDLGKKRENPREGSSQGYWDSLVNSADRVTALYLLDFNQCRHMPQNTDGVSQAVTAYLNNDPYYPRPFKTTHHGVTAWRSFAYAYLDQAMWIMKDPAMVDQLAGGFLRGIREHYRKKYMPAAARVAEEHAKTDSSEGYNTAD